MSDSIINDYLDAQQRLKEYFGLVNEYHHINFTTDELWKIEYNTVLYGGECEEFVGLYENDILRSRIDDSLMIHRRDDYTAIKCNDGCGNTDWYIFSNKCEVNG